MVSTVLLIKSRRTGDREQCLTAILLLMHSPPRSMSLLTMHRRRSGTSDSSVFPPEGTSSRPLLCLTTPHLAPVFSQSWLSSGAEERTYLSPCHSSFRRKVKISFPLHDQKFLIHTLIRTAISSPHRTLPSNLSSQVGRQRTHPLYGLRSHRAKSKHTHRIKWGYRPAAQGKRSLRWHWANTQLNTSRPSRHVQGSM